MRLYNFVSFAGIFILLIIAWLMSRFLFGNKDIINWHLICWGIGLQLLFALFIFIVPVGITLFQAINDLAIIVLSVASDGAKFVFGNLAAPPGSEGSLGFILAFPPSSSSQLWWPSSTIITYCLLSFGNLQNCSQG